MDKLYDAEKLINEAILRAKTVDNLDIFTPVRRMTPIDLIHDNSYVSLSDVSKEALNAKFDHYKDDQISSSDPDWLAPLDWRVAEDNAIDGWKQAGKELLKYVPFAHTSDVWFLISPGIIQNLHTGERSTKRVNELFERDGYHQRFDGQWVRKFKRRPKRFKIKRSDKSFHWSRWVLLEGNQILVYGPTIYALMRWLENKLEHAT